MHVNLVMSRSVDAVFSRPCLSICLKANFFYSFFIWYKDDYQTGEVSSDPIIEQQSEPTAPVSPEPQLQPQVCFNGSFIIFNYSRNSFFFFIDMGHSLK